MNAADLGARARLDAAFAREERRGLMLAAVARSVAVVLIIGWTAVANPERGLAYAWVAGTASLFLLTGVAQFVCYRRRLGPALMPYVFVAVDCLVLAAVLIVPNPFAAVQLPPPMPFRYANFLFFFVLLMQVTFSFRPSLLLWTGACGAGAWTLAFEWVRRHPGVITDPADRPDATVALAAYFNPHYLSVLKYQYEIVVFLLVSAGLALLVWRSRSLVAERAEAERERGNLARYFSPKVVDVLAERDEPLGRVRRQAVGVLFADLVGFTTLAEDMRPEDVMAMLRAFHGRMEDEVFRHGGCLEKFIGDALLATFGVPDVGARDATDALACARGMLAALAAWNHERERAGQPPLRMGVGLHYGPVVLGDIGSRRSMAFATVGDTINVASRLQSLTRDLEAAIVASRALVAAVEREAVDVPLIEGLASRGAQTLRGRDTPIEVWAA
ncbi:MAG TPA: adenylate/guanylate cyclase domain-containing protein [Candidatus Acidoferrum sp.]|nr:adenylate/guanylate cyclase domain-containing protein [Candidatus Acidoferrum sp.]